MDILLEFQLPGALLLVTLVFGWWVSHVGKPYNGLLFNIHKLIALGAVIVTGIQLSKTLPAGAQALIVLLLVLAAVCVAALFASGALMSANKLDYARMRLIHRIAPGVLVISLALVVYWLGISR